MIALAPPAHRLVSARPRPEKMVRMDPNPPSTPGEALRVAVVAGSRSRHREIVALLHDLPLATVLVTGDADVTIADGSAAPFAETGGALVVLGLQGPAPASDLPLALLPGDPTPQELDLALSAVAAGYSLLSPGRMDRPAVSAPGDPSLTPREMDVLLMLGEGLANKAIARRLEMSENTVKFHVGSILSKFDAQSRAEAVMIGARRGLLRL